MAFEWPAAIEIADARIAAGEPITQDLEHDFRDRDDHLLDLINESVYFNVFTGAQAAVAGEVAVVLDDDVDYRDRFIIVSGAVAWFDTLAHAQAFLPGGGQDDDIRAIIYNDRVAAANESWAGSPDWNTGEGNIYSAFMYTSNGSAAYNIHPYLYMLISVTADNMPFHLWVNSADGSLNMRAAGDAANYDNVAWNLVVGYSDQQEAY